MTSQPPAAAARAVAAGAPRGVFEAFFLPSTNGQCLCLYHPAQGPLRGAVIYVHPFAEEMNKARRMAALQARNLAQAGFAVLQIDLTGCGDSSRGFEDATWEAWIADLLAAERWLRQRAAAPLWLWGLRSGCLLAAAAAQHIDRPANFLFWHPVASGRLQLQQFLRLKLAGELGDGQAKGAMGALRARLQAGDLVEIAGYPLTGALAAGLEAAELQPPPLAARLVWLELTSRDEVALKPASNATLARWQAAGFGVHAAAVAGPAFWQTVEIEDAPALVEATMLAVLQADAL